jgi:hypothetical protein
MFLNSPEGEKIKGEVVVDEVILNAFCTLGLSPTKDLLIIRDAYKTSIRLVHPDKIKHFSLKWSKKDCVEAFNNIKNAYEILLTQYKNIDMPDYDITYSVEDFLLELKEPTFDCDQFNKEFEKQKEQELDGENNWGYDMFTPSECELHDCCLEEENLSRTIQTSTILGNPYKVEKPRPSTAIVSVFPENIHLSTKIGNLQNTILGELTPDVQISTSCGMKGVDLDVIYGYNYETWEKSMSRNTKVYKKYTDPKNIDTLLEKLQTERMENIVLDDSELNNIEKKLELDKHLENARLQKFKHQNLKLLNN